MERTRDVLTTGQVAKICNVAPRTVSKWFDTGQLRGYRIPGSKDRRIPLSQLVRFMRAHNIPLNGLDTGQTRLLILDADAALAKVLGESLQADGTFRVTTAASVLEAGVLAGTDPPHAMLVDVNLPGFDAREFTRTIRTNDRLQVVRLIATGGGLTEGQGQALLQAGFDNYLPKPFEIRQLVQMVDEAVSIVH